MIHFTPGVMFCENKLGLNKNVLIKHTFLHTQCSTYQLVEKTSIFLYRTRCSFYLPNKTKLYLWCVMIMKEISCFVRHVLFVCVRCMVIFTSRKKLLLVLSCVDVLGCELLCTPNSWTLHTCIVVRWIIFIIN